MGNGDTLKYRVGQLEDKTKSMDEKIDKMLTNHLPHIEMAILQLKTKLNMFTAINIGAIIMGIVLTKFIG